MEVSKTLSRQLFFTLLCTLVVLCVAWRLTPHIPNFAPLGAIALFAGMAFGRKASLLLVAATVVFSDALIGFYPGMEWTWLSYGLIAVLGLSMKTLPLRWRLPLGVLGTSSVFFVVSNFGVWIASGMYSLDTTGLLNCYAMALPFFKATLASDLVFVTVLLSAHHAVRLLATNFPVLQHAARTDY